MKVRIINHPLIKVRVSQLQDKNTTALEFRTAMEHVVYMLAYEACKNMRLKTTQITTPLSTAKGKVFADPIVICPILRAGLIMSGPLLSLLPEAIVYHFGIRRLEGGNKQGDSHEVYYRAPNEDKVKGAIVFIAEPMLATGGSINLVLSYLKGLGAKECRILSVIAAPEGINSVMDKHSDVELYSASMGDRLDKNNYIVPGLGDAGDRCFGTVD